MSHLIAPSILSADFGNLQRDIELINSSDADWFHIDIMDGAFVPNISFGFPVLKAIQKHAKKPLDVHLMIVDPDRYTQLFKDAGADVLQFRGVFQGLVKPLAKVCYLPAGADAVRCLLEYRVALLGLEKSPVDGRKPLRLRPMH